MKKICAKGEGNPRRWTFYTGIDGTEGPTAMVVVFLKRLRLSREGDWVSVSVDLNDGLDLNGIDAATFRLNESLPATEADAGHGSLRLKFPLSEVRALFHDSMRLTISGRLDDGVRVLGSVTAESFRRQASASARGMLQCATGR